jgi:hypothetical protein
VCRGDASLALPVDCTLAARAADARIWSARGATHNLQPELQRRAALRPDAS